MLFDLLKNNILDSDINKGVFQGYIIIVITQRILWGWSWVQADLAAQLSSSPIQCTQLDGAFYTA